MARAADSPIAAAIGRHDTTARRPAAIVSIHPTWLIETKDSPCRVFPFQPFPFFSTFFSLKFLSSGLIPLFFLSLRNHRLIAIFLQFMIHFDKMFFLSLSALHKSTDQLFFFPIVLYVTYFLSNFSLI